MRSEVIEAMNYAIDNKAKMKELHDAVGERIAELVGSEAAMVAAGASSAISLGTAACMTMGDKEKMFQLPDHTGLKHEVIIQKNHRYTYERGVRVPGATFVEIESVEDLRRAVGDKTAMLFFLLATEQGDSIPAREYVALGREYGIPTFCDAATTTPPASNIVETVSLGFDLTCQIKSQGYGLPGEQHRGDRSPGI